MGTPQQPDESDPPTVITIGMLRHRGKWYVRICADGHEVHVVGPFYDREKCRRAAKDVEREFLQNGGRSV